MPAPINHCPDYEKMLLRTGGFISKLLFYFVAKFTITTIFRGDELAE
jgi:hypothetical protein